jgi:beta-aspartyl-peptidase (threonine type)
MQWKASALSANLFAFFDTGMVKYFPMNKIAIAIHGGAGTILKSSITPELEREYHGGLENALKAGWEILRKNRSSFDAVEAAVVSLEDFPLFNAGRGSVFTHEGRVELDAAIMDGKALRAGAVAFVKNVKNPVKLARLVMEKTEHVLLAGEGADQFAREMGVELEPDDYFFTEHRWQQLREAISEGKIKLDHSAARPIGTVGAVACDSNGHLAAATSTGGMTNKKFGRVGDTALIGAGTYADDMCAVSCTGHGEFFMLGVMAYDIAARMKYKNLSLKEAAAETMEHLTNIGGEGGLIAVDSKGNVVLPFNSEGMYRGFVSFAGVLTTEIYH